MDRKHSLGFTLIELSVVLVIIGLIVGGVLVGRDLIAAAEVRQAGSTIEKLDTAVNTFRSKYNCLPGDCLNATNLFAGTVNGNGDGQIYGTDGVGEPNGGTENINFFLHMMAANLIRDTRVCLTANTVCSLGTGNSFVNLTETWGLSVPGMVAGQKWSGGPQYPPAMVPVNLLLANANYTGAAGTYRVAANHAYLFSTSTVAGSDYGVAFSPSFLNRLDTKFDDGLPLSGQVQALSLSGVSANTIQINDDSWRSSINPCMKRTTTPYVYLTSETPSCVAIWMARF